MSQKTNLPQNTHSVKDLHSDHTQIPAAFLSELQQATGKCDYPMTNDYIFRAVFQTNNLALKGLISALLRTPPESILSVEIINPISLGGQYNAKEFHLDINALLNNYTLINLEMQVVYQSDWHERSLIYVCRNLDSLSRGEKYRDLKPAIHIGILNEAPSHEGNEFYSEHMVMNVKTHKIYSDKLSLHVLRLDCIDNATAEDKAWKIDRWAKLFKATTWEEIMTITEYDEYLMTAADSLYLLNADEIARKRALDREDYYRDMQELKDLRAENAKKDASLAEKDATLAEKDATLAEKDALIAKLQAQLAEKNNT